MKSDKRRTCGFRNLLRYMRFPLCAFVVLGMLSAVGILIMRATLLQNAYETGTALARSCAAEERGNLNVYQTLLAFGGAALESRLDAEEDSGAVMDFLEMYFVRVETVLGAGVVSPHVVLDGKLLTDEPREGGAAFDYAAAPWYQQALEAKGDVVFTSVYIDAIHGQPVVTAAQSVAAGRAVIAFDILLESLRFETVDINPNSSFFLCDGDGTIIYQETLAPREQLPGYLGGIVEKIRSGELEDRAAIRSLNGERRGVYYAQMDNGWYAIITVPYSEIFYGLQVVIWPLMMMFIISFVAMVGLALRERRLTEKARRVDETSHALGNAYFGLYRIDYERETYEMIKGSEYIRKRIGTLGPYEKLLHAAGDIIDPETYREFSESFSCANIRKLVHQQVKNFGGEFPLWFGNEQRWVSAQLLFDEALPPGEVVLCFREVEEEKQRQKRERRLLEESLQMARQNEDAKQAFFRNMSHDMRTPLNAVLGSCELARQHLEEPERVAGYLDKIDSSGQYLLGLINDILEMARMESGQVRLEQRQFDLKGCVEECMSTFRIQAEKEGKNLVEHFHVRRTSLLGDTFRIQQVLNNLLSNAFKFTPENGTITLSIEQLDNEEYAKYKFVIADTGIGMSAGFLDRIFEPYSREMRFSERQAAGTGLGMSITKNLVSQMGGEIQVESTPGEGSTFTVILPLAAGPKHEEEPEKEEPPVSLEGLRLLLAEDNEINMGITTEILSACGAVVLQAWNGEEAVQRFRETEPFSVDAVLMDMQMPVIDGCEAARRIRSLDRPDAAVTPIIAVTANAFSEDIAATSAAGMDAHVSKPIDLGVLRKTLGRLLVRGADRRNDGGQKA